MRFWLIALSLLAAAYTLRAAEPGSLSVSWGIGATINCESVPRLDPITEAAANHWIAGFFSGANAYNKNPFVGQEVKIEEVISALKRYCLSHPDMMLATAANRLYLEMEKWDNERQGKL